MEIWKKYRDTIYEVSNYGEIRNLKTKKIKNQHKKNNNRYENDYVRVSLIINKKKKNVNVHRMVAECFLEDYKEELEVNHKNNIRYDNRVENLEMVTKEENYQYAINYGNGSQRKPLYALDVKENRIDFESLWVAAKYINQKYNKNIRLDHICTNIKHNLKGDCKSAYGYKWYWE